MTFDLWHNCGGQPCLGRSTVVPLHSDYRLDSTVFFQRIFFYNLQPVLHFYTIYLTRLVFMMILYNMVDSIYYISDFKADWTHFIFTTIYFGVLEYRG